MPINNVSQTLPGSILEETVQQVRDELGAGFDRILIERVVIGIFFIGVKLSDGSAGICATPIKEIPEAVCCPSSARAMPYPGMFRGRRAGDFLRDLPSQPPLKKAIGIAILNAFSASIIRSRLTTEYIVEVGPDALDLIEFPEDAYVVVVGALVPVLKRLVARGKTFGILELDRRTLKENELQFWVPQENSSDAIGKADMIIITGTTLLNNTLEPLLGLAHPGARIIVVGPTAGMIPDAFFRRGVTMLGGDIVTNADLLLDTLAEGGSGYHFFGKSVEKICITRVGAREFINEHLPASTGGRSCL